MDVIFNWRIILSNSIYSLLGIFLVIIGMVVCYKVMDLITPFNTGDELRKGNKAVGMVVQAMLLSIGIAVGLVVSLGLN